MGNMGATISQIFHNPIILGVLGFVAIVVFILCGWIIYSWFKGRKSKFGKSQERFQKCIVVTANNKLTYLNLKVVGNYVVDEKTQGWHILDPDALIPNLITGEYYLPIDERDAIPLFPLKPELRQAKVDELEKNIDSMAKASGLKVIHLRQVEKRKEEQQGQRNFALAAAFGILLLIVIGMIVRSFM